MIYLLFTYVYFLSTWLYHNLCSVLKQGSPYVGYLLHSLIQVFNVIKFDVGALGEFSLNYGTKNKIVSTKHFKYMGHGIMAHSDSHKDFRIELI